MCIRFHDLSQYLFHSILKDKLWHMYYEAIKNVIFKVKVGKNANNPTLPWYYAINIQPDE